MFLDVRLNVFLMHNYFLNVNFSSKDPEKVNSESFGIALETEIAFKSHLISRYQAERDKKYDFLYLGENEELNII